MTGVGFEKRAHSRARGRLWDDENLATCLRSEDNRNIYFAQILFVAITITGFLTALTMDKSVGAWRFAPS